MVRYESTTWGNACTRSPPRFCHAAGTVRWTFIGVDLMSLVFPRERSWLDSPVHGHDILRVPLRMTLGKRSETKEANRSKRQTIGPWNGNYCPDNKSPESTFGSGNRRERRLTRSRRSGCHYHSARPLHPGFEDHDCVSGRGYC